MCQNNNIFQGKNIVWTQIIPKICNSYLEISVDEQVIWTRNIIMEFIDKEHPWAYFGGATQKQGCGGDVILHLIETHYFHICLGLGDDTNNFMEPLTLRHLLHFALYKNYKQLQFYGTPR